MRITLKNFNDFKNEKIKKIDLIMNKSDIEESFENKETPKELKKVDNIAKISFGHFKLLEKIVMHEKLSDEKRMSLLIKYILRPINETVLDNSNVKIEEELIEKINNLDIGIVLNAIDKYYTARENFLYKRFNGVIYTPKSKEVVDKEDEEEVEYEKKPSVVAREDHEKKFFWHKLQKLVMNGYNISYTEVDDMLMSQAIIEIAEQRSEGIVSEAEARDSN